MNGALIILALLAVQAGNQAAGAGRPTPVRLRAVESWPVRNANVELVRFNGRSAVRMTSSAGDDIVDKLAVLPVRMIDGTIDVTLAGTPIGDTSAEARAYVGIAFRATPDLSRFEAIYLRPGNGRATDQLRRNRSTQYIAFPGRSWQQLRRASPGQYESYADVVPATWTRFRLELRGRTARLFVNGAPQPALVVNDLLPADQGGSGLALWIGNRTDAHFTAIKVTPRN